MAQLVKTVMGLAIANVKTIQGLDIASAKTIMGVDNTSGGGTPTLSSATVESNGTSLTLAFSESVSIGTGGDGGWTITMSGGAATLTYSSGLPGTSAVYTISRTVNIGETGTVGYTQPGNGIEATVGGIDLASIASAGVTNNSTQGGGLSLIAALSSAYNSNTSPKTTASLTVAIGDILVVCATQADQGVNFNTPTNTGTGLTFTSRQNTNVSGNCHTQVWTAPCTAAESITVSVATAVASLFFGVTVYQIRGSATGVGASISLTPGSAGTVALTTTSTNPFIVVQVADWNANDGASRTWATSNSVTPTAGNGLEKLYFRDAAQYAVYSAYYNNQGTAGSKTVGVSSPTGQFAGVAIEIKP